MILASTDQDHSYAGDAAMVAESMASNSGDRVFFEEHYLEGLLDKSVRRLPGSMSPVRSVHESWAEPGPPLQGECGIGVDVLAKTEQFQVGAVSKLGQPHSSTFDNSRSKACPVWSLESAVYSSPSSYFSECPLWFEGGSSNFPPKTYLVWLSLAIHCKANVGMISMSQLPMSVSLLV